MSGLVLNHIWHLRDLQAPPENWQFSVNYKVPIEDQRLKSLLQGETQPPLRVVDYPELIDKVQVLVTEVRGRTEGDDVIREGDFALRTVRVLRRLMRKPLQEGREKTLICVGDVLDPKMQKVSDYQNEFDLADLSSPSRAAVHRLDGLALEVAHKIFGEKAASLEQYPPDAIPPTRRVRVFLAYRRTHLEVAKRLHAVMTQMADGTIFDCFIDFHDMRLGDWCEQIFREIDNADVFVSLVSADYAEPETFGLVEFERGKQLAASRDWDDFFAPVFIADPDTKAGHELRVFDGYQASDGEEISKENHDLQHWLGRVAEAGIKRP